MLNLGYRDADERHQSLRACVDWSYQLCSELEQRFWARSSVFTGGYDLAAAAAVCGADDLPAGEILDLVSALVDQSILLADEAATGHTRYRMLSEIRQFGLERAEKDGELHGMQERHATWCAELVSRFDDDACGPRQRGLAAACSGWSTRTCGPPSSTTPGRPRRPSPGWSWRRRLDLYWSASGLLDEARLWLEVGLARGAGTPQQRAPAMAVAARFAVLQNDRVRAKQLLDEGTELAAAVEDTRALGLLLVPTAMLAVWDGTPRRGRRSGRLRSGAAASRVRPRRRAAGAVRRRCLSRIRRRQLRRRPTGIGSASPAPTRSASAT